MHIQFAFGQQKVQADLTQGMDISIPLHDGSKNPNAFGIGAPSFQPFRAGHFVGSVALGGPVNCENLLINPHGNGTHTECVGHISRERITINESLKQFFCFCRVVSVETEQQLIRDASIADADLDEIDAIILRTLPNEVSKKERKWSGNNPPAIEPKLCERIAQKGIRHLLTDLPSVDPEEDNGLLAAHHAFWQYPHQPRMDATITEMIFVPDYIKDGVYLLNIQIASIESDASPSKPVLYALHEVR